jgi:magnesium chelatase subunit D
MPDTLRPIFPFTALVGQERMKRALILNTVNPKLGGVLVRGEKGTAKSTAVRGLANLLPEIVAVADCPYGCDPSDGSACESCRDADKVGSVMKRSVPLVELPVGATEDRVVGTLDLERAIQEGQRRFEPGLLASANRGILYIDEVNLLNDHLVDVLLDAAAMGVNYVEREGVSVQHPAQFILVGTMNPEEGDLRPQLLDRFALAVEVEGLDDPEARAEVVRRRVSFEREPTTFLAHWQKEEAAERVRIQRAQTLLPDVRLDERMLRLITQLCVDFDVDGLRADIVMYKTALTLAAYAGRRQVNEGDVRDAAELALLHRRRRLPFQEPQLDRQQLDERIRERLADDPATLGSGEAATDGAASAQNEGVKDEGNGGERPPNAGDALAPPSAVPPPPPYSVKPLAAPSGKKLRQEYRGRRSRAHSRTFVGHYVSAEVPRERARDLALDATLRAAAPHQRVRRSLLLTMPPALAGGVSPYRRAPTSVGSSTPPNPPTKVGARPVGHPPRAEARGMAGAPALLLEPRDVRTKVRETRMGNLIVFVVDASGSMAARERMAAAKGAVMSLLLDAYQKRDQVGLIAFRGDGADLLLPPTNSVDLAQSCLAELPTGGRTPLGHGLQLGLVTVERHRTHSRDALPLLLLVSDGRANVSLYGGDPLSELYSLGAELQRHRVHTLLVDADDGKVNFGFGPEVASALGAGYLPVGELASAPLAGAARGGADAAWARWGTA